MKMKIEGNLADFLASDADTIAIVDPHDSSKTLSHRIVSDFVHDFDLGLSPLATKKQRVVVALPCGPTLALACLAVATYYTMAPMTPNCGAEQFRTDVKRVQATAIIVTAEDRERLQLRDSSWIVELGIKVYTIEYKDNGTFRFQLMGDGDDMQIDSQQRTTASPMPNQGDDIAIVLFTSGTSGTKKLVPIPTHTLISGVMFVIKSWNLGYTDRCLNMMPLHHIGGIVRNLFAPIIAGGSTICCSSFEPNIFWDLVEGDEGPTWYYASPSMHAAILSEAANRSDAVAKSRIRLVCNAAGGLLPTLATQLQDTFANCTVLPSYGMTECMPIATPPLSYRLDRPGTSGVSVGPEISIRDADSTSLVPGQVGSICVRGSPVFPGYLRDDDTIDASVFDQDGWFNTGDVGHLDQDGYLYITGRNKEVINRGGEILSPFEIEEDALSASMDPQSSVHGRMTECLAFSVPHEVLQEVVGLVVVVPTGKPRPSLDQLHEALKDSLHQSKLPVVLVYMNGLPKARNKLLRIKLSERMDLPTLTDSTSLADRYYEAACPPSESGLGVKINKSRCRMDHDLVSLEVQDALGAEIEVFTRINEADGFLQVLLFGKHRLRGDDEGAKRNAASLLNNQLRERVHGYLVPRSVHFMDGSMPLCEDGSVDRVAIGELLKAETRKRGRTQGPVQEDVVDIFATVLHCSQDGVDPDTDFFEAGGDSLRAGRLISMLRRHFKVQLASQDLYSNSTVSDLVTLIELALPDRSEKQATEAGAEEDRMPLPGCTETHSLTRPLVLLLHLLPLTVVYPLRLAFWWTLSLYGIANLSQKLPFVDHIHGRLLLLLLVVAGATTTVSIVVPLFGIATKWVVVGKHKEGVHPMWASYHNRWWFVQKVFLICGKGVFNYSNWLRVLYYRLLGAKIGKNVTIDRKAKLGEYDLIRIGDNAILDRYSICRPFAAERNTTMVLSPIDIGRNCTIGLSSIVAPGAFLPDDTCIGPNSSSWEISDATEGNREVITSNLPQPHWILKLLIVEPFTALAWFVGRIPWFASLAGLIQTFPTESWSDREETAAKWYTSPSRIGFHYIARISHEILGPIFIFLFLLLAKSIMDSRWVCGPIRSGTPMKRRSQMQKLRMAVLERLVPGSDIGELAALFGTHYEIVSFHIRALGGRVGKRVYWPGVGPSMQDFELLNIGNDVVFGSRAHLVTSNQTESSSISLGNGCMIADRVVVQPGTIVGERTVLGSGALTRPNDIFPPDSVWIGSKAGGCVPLRRKDHDHPKAGGDENPESLTPFGRAFYRGDASYRVIGLPSIICYSMLTTIFVSVYWNTPTVLAVKVVALMLEWEPSGFKQGAWYRPLSIYALLAIYIAIITTIQAIFALTLVTCAKWSLIGQRSPGSYDWDKSSYCQQWQIYLTIERIRQNCYGGNGIVHLLTGTHYIVLFFRALGGHIGENCALFANGNPSLFFTEPDLLVLGDRVAVDDASLVSHINSRGHFQLNRLSVGDRSVLRTGSRLLSGASMGKDARLLEHTLVMAGDHVDTEETYQGWPGTLYDKKV